MSTRRKLLALLVASTLLLSAAVTAAGSTELVEVVRNAIKLQVNGENLTVDSFQYNGITYVPLEAIATALGANLRWDHGTNTAALTAATSRKPVVVQKTEPVDPFHPVINLAELGLGPEQVDGLKLESQGQFIPTRFVLTDGQLMISDDTAAANGDNVLDFGLPYTLKLYASDGTAYRLDFVAGGLPDITDDGTRRIILVPAMPEKGFHWPYLLALPSAQYKAENAGHRRYLVVDTTNTGPSNSFQETLTKARDEVNRQGQLSIQAAEQLWLPFLMPVFPRPDVTFHQNEVNLLYTHALDRDTARLHLAMADPWNAPMVREAFRQAGFEVEKFLRLDLQLIAMIDHAIGYLNQYGHQVQPKKVFLAGYSASGTFTDRFATLHPDRVKAVASGATVDDMMLPLAEWRGKELIFPIGTSDYEEITGRPFDLAQHNQVARLLFMGEQDQNNTVPFSDCYGDRERQTIISLWGLEVLPRAKQLIQLYGQAGGKGMFILDKGVEHAASREMWEYVKTFLAANRDSDGPVYPIPENPRQLMYTLYE